jgi:hypothetical protein
VVVGQDGALAGVGVEGFGGGAELGQHVLGVVEADLGQAGAGGGVRQAAGPAQFAPPRIFSKIPSS